MFDPQYDSDTPIGETSSNDPLPSIARPNRDEIRNAIDTLWGGRACHELRAVYCKPDAKGRRRVDAGTFDSDHIDEFIEHAVGLNDLAAVYINLNPLHVDYKPKHVNVIKPYASGLAGNADIDRREYLLIDIDPTRPPNTSATDEQLEAAQTVAGQCLGYLTSKGWPEPFVCQSGNGIHLVYRIDLPNDESSTKLVEDVLQALGEKFDTPEAKVDKVVGNAGRIVKLYGTVANKGAHTTITPHRLSRITSVPDPLIVVSRTQLLLETPLGFLGEPPAKIATALHSPLVGSFDLDSFLKRLAIPYTRKVSGRGFQQYHLAHCPFNPEHGPNDSAVSQGPDGKFGFKCFHDSCSGKDWHALRALVEGDKVINKAATSAPNASLVAPPAPTWVTDINARFAEVRVGSSVVILDQRTPIETLTGVRYTASYLDISAFKQMHNGRYTGVAAGAGRAQPIAVAWLSNSQRRQYQGAVFSPDIVTPADILNLWTGFAVEPMAGDIAPWLRVLEAVVPDPATRRYVLYWLALKTQFPGSVPGTILLVKGDKGSGKNSLFEPVVRMFGSHGRVFDDPEQIAGRFTGHLQTIAFTVLDEALFTGNSQQADRIKSRVTATSTTFEAKGRDPIQGVNRCAYVSLSNHEHVWQATGDERRAVVVEASTALINDRAFWTKYHAWLDGPGPAALLHYLQNLKLDGFNPRVIPKGEALRRQIEQTALRDPATAWWYNILTEGAIMNSILLRVTLSDTRPTEINKSDLRQSFKGSTTRTHSGDWSNAMRKLKIWTGPGGLSTRRPRDGTTRLRTVTFAPLPELIKAFELATNIRIDEDLEP